MAKKTEITKRLLIPATVRGGCGKSTLCLSIVDWLKLHSSKPPFVCFDPDTENQTLLLTHPEHTQALDISRSNSLDVCVESLTKADVSVVDGLGSQQRLVFGEWAKQTKLLDIATPLGIGVTYLIVIDDSAESVAQAATDLETIRGKADWLIALNGHNKPIKHFELWPDSKAQRLTNELAETGKARIVKFDKTAEHLITFLTKNHLSVGTSQGRQGTSILDTNRLKTLLEESTAQLDSAESVLLPDKYLRRK